MTRTKPLPTFHALRLQHGISLEALFEYAEKDISLDDIRLFDETGRANPYTADDLLFALSEVAGQHYNRAKVSGIIFILARPPASPTDPQFQTGALSARPTLLELSQAYELDVDWLGEALRLNNHEVRDLLIGDASNPEAVARLLHMVSQYTGVTYTPDMIQLTQQTGTLSPQS